MLKRRKDMKEDAKRAKTDLVLAKRGGREDKGQESVRAGRTVEEMAEDIRIHGGVLMPEVLRRAVLGGMEVTQNKYGKSENIVVMGCFCFGVLLTVRSFCLLLNRLGVDYAFMRKEHCCGAPILTELHTTGQDLNRGNEYTKEFMGMNIAQAREQGAKNMIYFCIWCGMLGKRFFSDSDLKQLFFADVLVDRLKDVKLKLNARVGYYRGCLSAASIYQRDAQLLDFPAYRKILDRVEGLEVVDIPDHYCCKVAPKAIFARAEKEGLDTIVCICNDCYGRLQRSAPPGMKVRFLSDILLDAAGGHSR